LGTYSGTKNKNQLYHIENLPSVAKGDATFPLLTHLFSFIKPACSRQVHGRTNNIMNIPAWMVHEK